MNEMLERSLLLRIRQNITGGAQKNDRFVLRQICVREQGGVFGRIHSEVIVRAEGLDCRNTIGNRGVPITCSRRKNQNFIAGRLRLNALGETNVQRAHETNEKQREFHTKAGLVVVQAFEHFDQRKARKAFLRG